MAVGVITALLVTAMIYTTPSADSVNESNPPHLLIAPDGHTIIFPKGGGYNNSYRMRIHSDYTIVEAGINLIGLDAFDSVELGLYDLVSSDAADGISSDPQIVTDIYNDHFVFWIDSGSINSAKSGTDLFVKQWDYQTGSWSGITMLSHNNPNTFAKEPAAVTDSMGNIHVVWSENGNSLVNGGPDNDIFYCSWTGGAWSAPMLVSEDPTDLDSSSPDIAVDRSGTVHVVWRNAGDVLGSGTDNDIFYRSYNGTAWSAPLVLSDDVNDGNSTEPAVFAYGDNVYFAWSDDGNISYSGDDYDIIFMHIKSGFWSAPRVISIDTNDGDSRSPAITANSTSVFLAWQDNGPIQNSGTDYDINNIVYDIASDSLSEIEIVTDDSNFGDSVEPDILLDSFDNLYISWSDSGSAYGSGSDWDIFYRSVDKQGIHPPRLLSTDAAAGRSFNVSMTLNYQTNHIQFVWDDTANILGSGSDMDVFIKDLNFQYKYPTNLKLDIGADTITEWNYPGELKNETVLEGDWLGLKLTSLLEQGKSSAINGYVEIPLAFTSETAGALNISRVYVSGTRTPKAPANISIVGEESQHVVNHKPVFKWDFIDSDSADQGRFEVEIGSVPGGSDIWNPVPAVSFNRSIEFSGTGLMDGETYYFQVRVTDADGSTWSPWSQPFKFRMNSAPVMQSLTPAAGTFDRYIPLSWSAKDSDDDPLTYFIRAYYQSDQQWHPVVQLKNETRYNWNVSALEEQDIDIECFVTDGYENSSMFNPSGEMHIVHNTPPKLQILTPLDYTVWLDKTYLITWNTEDPDEDDVLRISLYYDEDTNPVEKHLIIENYTDIGFYQWDTSDIPRNKYYILGVISDGTDSAYAYSNGTIELGSEPEVLPPQVRAVLPEPNNRSVELNDRIIISFTKALDETSINHSTFYVKSTNILINGEREYDSIKRELKFEAVPSFKPGTTYTVVLTSGIRDRDGAYLDGNRNGIGGELTDDVSWSFTTKTVEEDRLPPMVTSTSPGQDAMDVDITTSIHINFSEPILATTLTSRSFMLIELEQFLDWNKNKFSIDTLVERSILGDVSYSNEMNQAVLNPKTTLMYNTTYVVVLMPQITDENNNPLIGNTELTTKTNPFPTYPFIYSFTTTPESVPSNGDHPEPEEDNGLVIIENWTYVYVLFLVLLIIIIAVITWVVRNRILMGPISIRDVFIIYRDGRLLYHYSLDKIGEGFEDIDESAVSSMLTAIQDFVKDSFKFSRGSSLNELKHGMLRILIEHGDNSYVAVVCSGGPTSKIREEMKNIINDLNTKYKLVLKNWNGNMNAIAGIDKLIVPLIMMEKDLGNGTDHDVDPDEPEKKEDLDSMT